MNKPEHSLRNEVLSYAKSRYGTDPEYLWTRFPDYAVIRHSDNSKWYGIIMNIDYSKIDREKSGTVDILDIKLTDPLYRDMLAEQKGFYKGYHISRGNWLTAVLDGTVDIKEVKRLLDMSFEATSGKKKKAVEHKT